MEIVALHVPESVYRTLGYYMRAPMEPELERALCHSINYDIQRPVIRATLGLRDSYKAEMRGINGRD